MGLGNPGARYDKTRHNLGFEVLDALAKEWRVEFFSKARFEGDYAKAIVHGQTIHLLKPMTYMNLSGRAVKKCLQFFKLKREELLVISDDVSLDFEQMRLKPKGSSGGHNGLRHIEGQLGPDYPRLRMGVSEPKKGQPLEDYVLESFNRDEKNKLDSFVQKAVEIVDRWILLGIEKAMNQANEKN